MKIKCKCEDCGHEQEQESTKITFRNHAIQYLIKSVECEECGGALWFMATLSEVPRKAIGVIKK